MSLCKGKWEDPEDNIHWAILDFPLLHIDVHDHLVWNHINLSNRHNVWQLFYIYGLTDNIHMFNFYNLYSLKLKSLWTDDLQINEQ